MCNEENTCKGPPENGTGMTLGWAVCINPSTGPAHNQLQKTAEDWPPISQCYAGLIETTTHVEVARTGIAGQNGSHEKDRNETD
jgi:hypothetical protein